MYVTATALAVVALVERHAGHVVSADVEMVGSLIEIALAWIYDALRERA